jgi:Family of unknown function (DUF6345)
MREAGHDVEFLFCDEELALSSLDGTKRFLQDGVDILYVMTHGNFGTQGYAVELNASQWLPAVTGIGTGTGSRLSVAIFDTCHLINSSQNWESEWTKHRALGNSLRLILGFEGTVAIDQGSALRGKAFADELLSGKTFVDAWLVATDATIKYDPQYKMAVAIGIGDTAQDASAIITTASLAHMPAARSGQNTFLKLTR